MNQVALVLGMAWMATLTLVLVLTVRQIVLLTARLDAARGAINMSADGLEIGLPVPREVLDVVPEADHDIGYVLLLSASCTPCRELIPHLAGIRSVATITTLVPGPKEAVESIVGALPQHYRVVRDPLAAIVAQHLALESTPFAMQIERGIVTGKAYLHSAKDLASFVDARAGSDAAEYVRS